MATTTPTRVNSPKLIFAILALFTWFIGGLLYLFLTKTTGFEKIVAILSIFIPVIPAIILILYSLNIINI